MSRNDETEGRRKGILGRRTCVYTGLELRELMQRRTEESGGAEMWRARREDGEGWGWREAGPGVAPFPHPDFPTSGNDTIFLLVPWT